jgi:hypothetical protein
MPITLLNNLRYRKRNMRPHKTLRSHSRRWVIIKQRRSRPRAW